MTDFADSSDPALGAACDRLAAFTLPIPKGAVVDEASGLTEADLVRILQHCFRTRQSIEVLTMEEAYRRYGGSAVPVEQLVPVDAWSDAQLLQQYQKTSGEPGDVAADTLLAEIQRRNLDV